MAVFTKYWPNGDALTLTTGAGGISVESDPNLTGDNREMTIQVRTTNSGEKVTKGVLIKQLKEGVNIPSFLTLNDDTRINFELSNTPIANFCVGGDGTAPLTVNGQTVVKNTIKTIVFGSSYDEVEGIGNQFMAACTSITSIDLSVFTSVTTIGTDFLRECSALTSIDLSGFTSVTSIGDQFVMYCYSLTSIDLSSFTGVTSIGDNFFRECTALVSVNLSGMVSTTSIGNYFFHGCLKITSIDLSPLVNVTSVGTYFLGACTGLTSVQIGGVDWSARTVGAYTFWNITNSSSRTLYADTATLATKFKGKFTNTSKWTVVVN